MSKGDTVYASLEPENERHLTIADADVHPDRPRARPDSAPARVLSGVRPGLLRRCPGRPPEDFADSPARLLPRAPGTAIPEDGYLRFCIDPLTTRGPLDQLTDQPRLPDDWVEEPAPTASTRMQHQPASTSRECISTGGSGRAATGTRTGHACRRHSGSACTAGCPTEQPPAATSPSWRRSALEGRVTATTMLVAFDRALPACVGPEADDAQKLLDFVDNRQDASLQAGHFNDFVQVAQLRRRSVPGGGEAGAAACTHDDVRASGVRRAGAGTHRVAAEPRSPIRSTADTDRACARSRVPPLRRPATRLAGHTAQPRADRPAAHRLSLASTSMRQPRAIGRRLTMCFATLRRTSATRSPGPFSTNAPGTRRRGRLPRPR